MRHHPHYVTVIITVTSHAPCGVSNHRQLDSLFNNLFRLTSKKHQIFASQSLYEGPEFTGVWFMTAYILLYSIINSRSLELMVKLLLIYSLVAVLDMWYIYILSHQQNLFVFKSLLDNRSSGDVLGHTASEIKPLSHCNSFGDRAP